MDSSGLSSMEMGQAEIDLPPPYCPGSGSWAPPRPIPGMWPDAPPTYQDAMGGPAQLIHQDFLPDHREDSSGNPRYKRFGIDITIEDFEPQESHHFDLITKVNAWLSENGHMKVTSCEVLKLKRSERMTNIVDPDASVSLEYLSFRRTYVNGLRLWLMQKTYDEDPTPMRLGYHDIVPRCRCGRQVRKKSCSYQTLREAVEEYNRRSQEFPIPGRILSVQTVVRYVADTRQHEINTESTHWSETRQLNNYAYTIRLFYLLGQPLHQKIDFYDFKPDLLKLAKSLFDNHKFEPFSAVYQRASSWVCSHPDINVLGVQTIDCKIRKQQISHINEQNTFNPIEPFFNEKGANSSTALLQVVRVYYTLKEARMSCRPVQPITYKTFVPCQLVAGDMLITLDSYETLEQSNARMKAWLKEAGVDASQVLSTETVPVQLYDGVQDGKHEDMLKYHRSDTIRVLMYVVRVYFTGSFTEPSPHLLPPVPKVKRQKHTGCILA